MKKLFLSILTVISASNIAGEENVGLAQNDAALPQPINQQDLFSKEMVEALKEVDPVKFEAALKNTAPLCKYGKSFMIKELMGAARIMALERVNFGMSEINKRRFNMAALAFIATSSCRIYGFYHAHKLGQMLILQHLKKELDKKMREKEFHEKNSKKLENLKLMIAMFANHPTKDCC